MSALVALLLLWDIAFGSGFKSLQFFSHVIISGFSPKSHCLVSFNAFIFDGTNTHFSRKLCSALSPASLSKKRNVTFRLGLTTYFTWTFK